jgi:hypothetical protein
VSERTARRVAWLVFCVACGLWLAAATFSWLTRSLASQSGWGGGGFAVAALFGLVQLAFPAAGLLLARRRPRLPIGWLLLGIGVAWGLAGSTGYADYGLRLHPGSLPAAAIVAAVGAPMWAPAIGITCTFLILLFPDGRLPGPRWRWVAWVSAVAIVGGTAADTLTPGEMASQGYPGVQNPLGVGVIGSALDVGQLLLALIPVMMVASAASLVVRFRRAGAVQRQQIKWLASAAAVVAVSYLLVLAISLIAEPSNNIGPLWLQAAQDASLLSFGLIPIAIGVAVLRHGLFEIDVIIRKTLVYSTLVASLGLLYLAGVVGLQALVRSVIGQSGAVAVTASTLVVAGAFQPLRTRIQRAVDRRFYRARYDVEAVVEAFSGRLREQIDLDALHRELLAVVAGAVQPVHASLWLRPGPTAQSASSTGSPSLLRADHAGVPEHLP